MWDRARFSFPTLIAIVLFTSTATGAPFLHLSAGAQGPNATVAPGGGISLEILVSEIPAGSDGNGLFGFGVLISFDPQVLSASSPTLGPLWVAAGFSSTHLGSGTVGLTANRFFQASGPQGDDILLATIDFTGLTEGFTALSLTHFSGAGDNVLFDGTRLDSQPEEFFQNSSIQVTPEPSTVLLFASGLLAMALRSQHRAERSRRRRTSTQMTGLRYEP